MKGFTGLKLAEKSGRMRRNYQIMSERFQRHKLLQRVFSSWSGQTLKLTDLRGRLILYQEEKGSKLKRQYLNEWQFAYNSKIKVTGIFADLNNLRLPTI